MTSIAVIGAGISGLSFGRALVNHSRNHQQQFNVTVFDKSWHPGGRVSTRKPSREYTGSVLYQFDHGAQYFTIKDKIFEHEVKENWIKMQGIVKEWNGKIVVLNKDEDPSSAGNNNNSNSNNNNNNKNNNNNNNNNRNSQSDEGSLFLPSMLNEANPPQRFVGVPGMNGRSLPTQSNRLLVFSFGQLSHFMDIDLLILPSSSFSSIIP